MRADQLPNGARFVEQGNEKYFELDATTDINALTQRVTLPQGPTRAIRLSATIRSDLQYNRNGYEGIAQDVQCLVRNGTSRVPLRTYHNDPFASGNPDLYLPAGQFPNWTQVDIITQIPYDVDTQFIDVSLGQKAFAGQLQIRSWSTRNHYQDRFITSVGPAIYTRGDFQFQTINAYGGRLTSAYLHYFNTHSVRIGIGQPYTITVDAFLNNIVVRGLAANRLSFFTGIMLKMLRDDGTVDFRPLSLEYIETGLEIVNRPIIITTRVESDHQYIQIEPIFYVYTDGTDSAAFITADHGGMSIGVVVHDSEATGVV